MILWFYSRIYDFTLDPMISCLEPFGLIHTASYDINHYNGFVLLNIV